MTPNRRNYLVLFSAVALMVAGGVMVVSRQQGENSFDEKIGERSEIANGSFTEDAPEKVSVKTVKSKDWFERSISIKDVEELKRTRLTPELARILLDKAKVEIGNVTDRTIISAEIITVLCKQGFLNEAWELVEKDAGSVRDSEISTFFVYDSSPLSIMLDRLKNLPNPGERSRALHGIIISRPSEFVSMDFRDIHIISPKEKMWLAGSILAIIKVADSGPGVAGDAQSLLKKSLELLQEGKLNTDHLVKILKGDSTNDAFQQWSLVDKLKGEMGPKDVENLRVAVVPNMIKSDAKKSMDWFCADPATKYSYPVLRTAIDTMYEVDPQGANAWVTTNLPGLDKETGQRLIASLTQVSLKSGEFDTARQWAVQVENPTIRKQILEQIQTKQSPPPPAHPEVK